MARPGALITDFRHLPDDLDITDRSLEAFLASIVAAASLEGPEARIRVPLRCRRRPKRRACPGAILVDRHRGYSEVEWHCSECDFNGIITHWEGSAWDVGAARPAPKPATLDGRWRIVEMESWGEEARDLMGPAFIEFDKHGGSLLFIAVEGALDCRYGEVDGRPSVEFSWMGFDDRDAACGRGWARLQADGSLAGHIFIHDGDDSAFRATRGEAGPARSRRSRQS